ncbi:hypothetical protein ACQ4PT_069366 [Festuca glaucescens]
MGSKLIGCGSAVPSLTISNDDLSKVVETSDEWIATRTGIRSRRVLSGDETLGGLAVLAAQRALEMAQVLAELGCSTKALGFDITAACSGFIIGLITATQFIKGSGDYQNVLVVGADALSQYVDWTDRVLQACSPEEDGLLGFCAQSDGNGQKHLHCSGSNAKSILSKTNGVPGFPPKKGTFSCIEMNGKEVFRFAVRCVPQSIEKALEEASLPASSIDWLLLHQANQRIIDAAATRLSIPSEKVISNLANYGNTSAASIPLALDEAVRGGKVKRGDIIAASGFGAGLTWGSAIVKWG